MSKRKRHPWLRWVAYCCATAGLLFAAQHAMAQTTAAIRVELVKVQQQMARAQKHYAAKEYDQAARIIAEARQSLSAVPVSREFKTKAARRKLETRLLAAESMLKEHGVPLPDLAPAQPMPDPMPDGARPLAAGPGGIRFIKDIAPLLQEKCFHCHGGDQTRGQLRLVTFEGIQRGGANGPLFRGANTANSRLLMRLRGQGDGEQMPPDDDPLSEEQIGMIEQWIAAGAPFDGGDPAAGLAELIIQFQIGKMSHEQLWAQREQLVQKNWELGMPGVQAALVETQSLRVMGTAAAAELKRIAEATEALLPEVAKLLGAPVDPPLLKGGATIYIVHRRYDYSEFGQMVEQRSLPRGSHGHWRFNGRDAYGVVLYGAEDTFSKPALLAEQYAGLTLASRGLPNWFSEGAGLAIASRLAPKDKRLEALRNNAKLVFRQPVPVERFLKSNLPPDESRLISFGFAERLMASKKSWSQLMAALQDGKDFSSAFVSAYRATPDQLLGSMRSR